VFSGGTFENATAAAVAFVAPESTRANDFAANKRHQKDSPILPLDLFFGEKIVALVHISTHYAAINPYLG
jgi:hypothetical protein